jgi:hypothetical protein
MTRCQVHYSLQAQPSEDNFDSIRKAGGWYGVQAIRLSPQMDSVMVEYDASRLTLPQVDAIVARIGLAASRRV